jgi:beta-xylosidase
LEPGLPLFHSRDLVNWRQIANVATPVGRGFSKGFYAPTLRFHDGRFWLVVTDVGGRGNVLYSTSDPAGAWEEVAKLHEVRGIDPDLAWDDDGVCWCTTAGGRQLPISTQTGEATGSVKEIWSGSPNAQSPEAPHLYHIGEWWYLLISEGGTECGHSLSIARSRSVRGPFEPCPRNPILTHRGLDLAVQNVGHGDLVEAPDGSWWLVVLGVRPRGGTPGWHVLGRETFLTRVEWDEEGWPLVDLVEEGPIEVPWELSPFDETPRRQNFDQPLGLGWVTPSRRGFGPCSLTDKPGWLTLRAGAGSLEESSASFIAMRQNNLEMVARARIDPTKGVGGMSLWIDDRHHFEVEAKAGMVRVRARIGPLSAMLAEHPIPDKPVVLRIQTVLPNGEFDPRLPPDRVVLGFERGDWIVEMCRLDGRYLSTEVAGGFTGRLVGLYATSGMVSFNWFEC